MDWGSPEGGALTHYHSDPKQEEAYFTYPRLEEEFLLANEKVDFKWILSTLNVLETTPPKLLLSFIKANPSLPFSQLAPGLPWFSGTEYIVRKLRFYWIYYFRLPL